MQQRSIAVKQLAESLGYSVIETPANLEISLNKKKMFAYAPVSNSFFTYKSRYSKQLDPERFLAYIRTCLNNALCNTDKVNKTSADKRYSVDRRANMVCVYDDHTGSKVDSFFNYNDAIKAANKLNMQWGQSVKTRGENHETGK